MDCKGEPKETKQCEIKHCPINGQYTLWSPWGSCSATCGKGLRLRQRTCNNPAPAFGGKPCAHGFDQTEKEPCKIKECPVNGAYTKWTEWTTCSATCGEGTHSR